jgi:NADH-quinone oxidoreductase subunit H
MLELLELMLWALAKILVLFLAFGLGGAAVLSWVERRMSAIIQDRVGPVRANVFGITLFGLLHPVADGIKMFFKEDFVPRGADRILFFLAPLFSFAPPLIAFMAIPFGPPVGEYSVFHVTDSQMGVLFLLATASVGIYGHTLAGWSSDNKFSLMGALRTSSQLFSYEVGLTLSLLGVFMVYGTIMPQQLISEQSHMWFGVIPRWGIFTQPFGFLLFIVAAIAETKRAPFDLPEADSEIVAGYSTEYSSMRFAMFFLSEFVGILLVAAFGSVLFLGGWHVPFLEGDAWWVVAIQVGAFLAKTGALVYLQMLVRWTLPRLRFDQMMNVGWKYFIPFGLANVIVTAVVLLFV